jgi:hypothetical protein
MPRCLALGGQAIDEGTKKVVSGADKLLATKMESAVGKIHKGAEAAREKLHEGAELAKQGAKGALAGVEAAADRAVTGAKDVASGVHGDSQLFGSKKLKQLVTAVTNPEQAQGSISGPPPEEKSDKVGGPTRGEFWWPRVAKRCQPRAETWTDNDLAELRRWADVWLATTCWNSKCSFPARPAR